MQKLNCCSAGIYSIQVKGRNVPGSSGGTWTLVKSGKVNVEIYEWNGEYEQIFQDTDLDLDLDVQQLLSQFDDISMYNEVAYVHGHITEEEYLGLKSIIKTEIKRIRESNKIPSSGYARDIVIANGATFDAYDTVTTVGGFLPYVGFVLSLLGDTIEAGAIGHGDVALNKIYESVNYEKILSSITRTNAKYGTKYVVYELFELNTGNVKYVGRTRQNLYTRQKQHWIADKAKRGLQIRVAELDGKLLSNLTYSQARGLEHLKHEELVKKGMRLLNKIRPMNRLNKKTATKNRILLKHARGFLKKII